MEGKRRFKPNPQLRLMDQIRQVLRYHHYAYRTEQAYCDWIVRYVKFHGATKHPKHMGKSEVEAFLSHLATNRNVAVSTQRQALNALIFLYRHVLDKPIEGLIEPVRSKRHRRPPVVMAQGEVQRVLLYMHGTHLLMAQLMYGGGLRLMECVRLRIKDLDFERRLVYVCAAKEGKDRTTLFPASIHTTVRMQVEKVKQLHDEDLSRGYGEVYIPEALARKYRHAARDFRWQYVFPAKKMSTDPRTGKLRRHHVLESGLQKAVKIPVHRAGIIKRVSCHTFRHHAASRIMPTSFG
jgi:integron integrase